MPKVKLKVGDLVKKWHLNVVESGILIERHESYWNEDEKRQVPVMWNIFGWTKPKRALDSSLKKGIAEGRIIHAPIRNSK
jgi:hypothetical protein|tara:strand:+ start:26 stop:265 length:240 start_codon:yes stop_codon:yes gene_type:complete